MDFLSVNAQRQIHRSCYATNNNYAYKFDKHLQDDETNFMGELKHSNFVPSYDPWCLNCGNMEAKKICSGCKSVYFCDKKCQAACWPIHKTHCDRDLFTICCNCGASKPSIKCPGCPVKFCSKEC